MTTSIDALAIRRRLGRATWQTPQPFGPDGWVFLNSALRMSMIVSVADHEDGHEWIHVSMAGVDRLPEYEEVCLMHHAVWGDEGYAYQVFAPAREHVNIHQNALHLWGRLNGSAVLPIFAGPIPGFEKSI
jgi:hypothetical protein